MYEIEKIISGTIEMLPDIVDTPIWEDYNDTICSNNVRIIAQLYMAISQRENYYQLNSPTAFGDPQYKYCCGLVQGIFIAGDMEESLENNKIVIRKKNRKIMSIDKIKRPQSYYDDVNENQRIMKELGF